MKPFEDWSYQDAVDEIAARKNARVGEAGYDANRAMAEAYDFWQDGKTWVGPRGTAAVWVAALKAAVAQQHVPGAASLEALGNFARGLFGKEANVQLVPRAPVAEGSDEEAALKKEAEEILSFLSAWWDRVGLWAKLRQAGVRSRWATWGPLRLWIPSGRLAEGEDGARALPSLPSFEGALGAIELSAPEPDHAIAFTHPDTQARAALFHFVEQEDGRDVNRVELWYQDAEQTRLRILPQSGEPEDLGPYPWGGEVPVAEVDGELLLTEVVRRQEAALDFAETNVVKVGETAGFRERYTMNAEPNGLWLTTEPPGGATRTHTDEQGKTLYFWPTPRSMGPAVTTDLIGVKTETGTTGEKRATPGVEIADPVDPEFATKGAEYRRARVLQLCHQGHLAMIGTGEASGFAYEQARAAFRGDLEWHKSPAEIALLRLLVTAIRMAESMASEARSILERFRLVVTLTPDPGPLAPDYMEEIRAQVKEGLLSRASALGKLGVEDVQAELAAIDQDPEAMLGVVVKRVGVITSLLAANPNMPMVAAAVVAGWEEAEAKKLFADADAATAQDRQGRQEMLDALQRGRGNPAPPQPEAA